MPIQQIGAPRSLLREFVEAVPGAVYAKDCEGRILLGNRAFAEAVGWRSGGFIGKNDLELLADKQLARAVMENDQRILAGRVSYQVEEKLQQEDGSTAYWLSTKAPFFDDDGNVAGLVGVSINITERKRLEERERLFAREVEHRNKNLLGVVQSVLQLTRSETVDEYREAVMGRLSALARVQGVLAREHHQEVDLRALLYEELAAYSIDAAGRIRLNGPAVSVNANAAQPLAVAFHELATNAAKHGAFRDASGRLEVTWSFSAQSGTALAIEWREFGAPPVEPASRAGFGNTLIRSVVELQLKGTLMTAWEPSGVNYLMSFPLHEILANRSEKET